LQSGNGWIRTSVPRTSHINLSKTFTRCNYLCDKNKRTRFKLWKSVNCKRAYSNFPCFDVNSFLNFKHFKYYLIMNCMHVLVMKTKNAVQHLDLDLATQINYWSMRIQIPNLGPQLGLGSIGMQQCSGYIYIIIQW